MKKCAALFLSLLLLAIGLSSSLSETQDINIGELEALALSVYIGDGYIIDAEPTMGFDGVNSRYVMIGKPLMGYDLVIMIRISQTQVCVWPLELNEENLVYAKTVLMEENSPFCMLSFYENDEITKSAMYGTEISFMNTYDEYMAEVDEILGPVTIDETVIESSAPDPILSLFPGLEWGMSRADLINKYSEYSFPENLRKESVIGTMQTVLDESTRIMFSFTDDKLDYIAVAVPDTRVIPFFNQYTVIIGNPILSTFREAIKGQYPEEAEGDCFVWKTDKIAIILSGKFHLLQIRPLN